jgi:hypothetical protein
VEWVIQWFFLIICLIALPFWLKSNYFQQWLLVYFLVATLSELITHFPISYRLFEFPVRFLPRFFESSILFDIVVFPTINVLFNWMTLLAPVKRIIILAIVISAGMTGLEYLLEKYTPLIHYYQWTALKSFVTIFLFLLVVRGFMALVRRRNFKIYDC